MSDLWSMLIGIADKLSVNQGREDLKAKSKDWLVRGAFASEFVRQGQN